MERGARQSVLADGGAAVGLTGAFATVALLYIFRSVLWPFALAVVIAIVIQALKRAVLAIWPRANRGVVLAMSAIATLGLMIVAALVFLSGLSPMVKELPLLQRRIDGLLLTGSEWIGLEDPIMLRTLLGGVDIRAAAGWTLRTVRGAATGLVLTTLFAIFLLFTWRTIARRVRLAVGGRRSRAADVLARSIRGVEAYLWIQTVAGVITAAVAGAVMFAVGLDHWPFWTVALFMLSYIPFLGIAVGSIVPALFALLQFPSPTQGLILFLAIQVVAFLVGNLLVPRMQATTQNIDPCVGLLAVGCWSILWGLPGTFLAIPLTVALIYQFASVPRLRWLAILLSHNGDPLAAPQDAESPEPGRGR